MWQIVTLTTYHFTWTHYFFSIDNNLLYKIVAHHIVAQKNVVVDLKMYGIRADHTETTKDKKCCASNHFDYEWFWSYIFGHNIGHNSPHSKLWPMLWQQNVSFDYLNIGRKLFVLFIKDDMTLLLTATWYSKLGCCFKTSCCCWGFFYKFLWRGTMSMPTTRWHNFSSSSPPTVTKQCIFLFLNNQYNHSMNAIREVKRKS